MVYGLVRVSTKEQNEDRQVAIMEKLGIPIDNIKIEKQSGRNFNRKVYKNLKALLKKGDVLYIENIDRLGRNYEEITNEWYYLTKQRKIIIRVVAYPILNTDNKNLILIDKFIRDITLLILAFQAEQEYENIKRRQEQGIAIAKEKGKRFGRPKKEISDFQREIINQWESQEITTKEAMKLLDVKKSAFYNLKKRILETED